MHYTTADIAERNAFIDKSIAETLQVLGDPEIIQELGSRASRFTTLLESATVSNIRHGWVSVPEGTNEDSLLLTGVRADEVLIGDETWATRTQSQKQAVIAHFEKWQPRHRSATEIFANNYEAPRSGEPLPLSLSSIAEAQTVSLAGIVSGKGLIRHFSKAPSKGMAVLHARPQILLKVRPERPFALPDAVVHELVHVEQYTEAPVRVLRSQEHIDSQELRTELEAYHIGSIITLHTVVKDSQEVPVNTAELMKTYRGVQIAVELLRQEVGFHPSDPYNPTKKMMAAFAETGLNFILHSALDYKDLLERTGLHAKA